MDLNLVDNIDNIVLFIKNNPNNILDVFDYLETNYNDVLLQKLKNRLIEKEISVSEQVTLYHKETISLEQELQSLLSVFSFVVESVNQELEQGNCDFEHWTKKYRNILTDAISKFCISFKNQTIVTELSKLYSLLIINGFNLKKIEMMINLADDLVGYCRKRREILIIFVDDSLKMNNEIIQVKESFVLVANKVSVDIDNVFSGFRNRGLLKIGFLSQDIKNKQDIMLEIDDLISLILKTYSIEDLADVKNKIYKMDSELKQLLKQQIIGMDKEVLAKSNSVEGLFYRTLMYANQL